MANGGITALTSRPAALITAATQSIAFRNTARKGTATADRYSGSTYGKSGGFRDSQYASKSGNYRDSHFATPNAGNPDADHSSPTLRQRQQAIRGPALHAASVRSSAEIPPAQRGEKVRETIAVKVCTGGPLRPKGSPLRIFASPRVAITSVSTGHAIFKPPDDPRPRDR